MNKIVLALLLLPSVCFSGQIGRIDNKPNQLHWPFNEGTGANNVDTIQYVNLSGVGGAWVTGLFGSAKFLSATTDGMAYSSFPKTISVGAHWLHLWVRTTQPYDSSTAGWKAYGYHVINLFNGGTTHSHWGINAGGCGKAVISTIEYVGSWGTIKCGSTPINDGRWHMIDKVRFSATNTTRLFVDGKLDWAGSTGKTIAASTTIGTFYFFEWGDNEYDGDIDDLYIMSNTSGDANLPTDGEIARLYQMSVGRYNGR